MTSVFRFADLFNLGELEDVDFLLLFARDFGIFSCVLDPRFQYLREQEALPLGYF